MIFISTNKLLIITWVAIAFLIGGGVGYLLGVQGFGQKTQGPEPGLNQQQFPQQQNFGPGQGGQNPQQGGSIQQPLNQGGVPAGAPGGRNPVPNQNGEQPVNPNQPLR